MQNNSSHTLNTNSAFGMQNNASNNNAHTALGSYTNNNSSGQNILSEGRSSPTNSMASSFRPDYFSDSAVTTTRDLSLEKKKGFGGKVRGLFQRKPVAGKQVARQSKNEGPDR